MSDKPKSKFIVAISDATAENRDAISNRLKNLGFGYWHWMPDIWLLTTSSALTAESIRDEVMKLAPSINIFVTPVANPPGGMIWATYSPEEWQEWLNKNWT
jgi:hypothetical protein